MGFFRRFRDAAACVVLLALPFFFLEANLKNPAKTNFVDRAVLSFSAPIQYVAKQVAGGVSGVLERYVFLVDVREDNEQKRQEIARLREEARTLRIQARENKRLRALLQLREHLATETTSALVIGKEVSQFFRVVRIRLDRGERDRVREGMPVVSAQGLVGQVRRVWGRYSDVLLTVDRTSAVDVVVQRTGARGILRGTGESRRYLCRIQYLQRTDDVRVGDEIHTSGFGQRFPAAILVGRVSHIEKRESGLYQEAEVVPTVNVSELEEVLLLTAGSREQSVDEEGGGSW